MLLVNMEKLDTKHSYHSFNECLGSGEPGLSVPVLSVHYCSEWQHQPSHGVPRRQRGLQPLVTLCPALLTSFSLLELFWSCSPHQALKEVLLHQRSAVSVEALQPSPVWHEMASSALAWERLLAVGHLWAHLLPASDGKLHMTCSSSYWQMQQQAYGKRHLHF